jgi:hypothetical protein
MHALAIIALVSHDRLLETHADTSEHGSGGVRVRRGAQRRAHDIGASSGYATTVTRSDGICPVPEGSADAQSMTCADNADVEVIHQAMDRLHVQLVSRDDGAHVHWHWDGHDGTLTNRGWSTRDDAIAYMRTMLDDRRDASS